MKKAFLLPALLSVFILLSSCGLTVYTQPVTEMTVATVEVTTRDYSKYMQTSLPEIMNSDYYNDDDYDQFGSLKPTTTTKPPESFTMPIIATILTDAQGQLSIVTAAPSAAAPGITQSSAAEQPKTTNSSASPATNCNHSFSAATCTEPKICSKCGQTQGKALGHVYSRATCTAPKTCSRCGETVGDKAGHRFIDDTCTVCGSKRLVSKPAPEAELLKLMNQMRAEKHLSALTVDTNMGTSARIRARELTENFSHTRPGGKNFSTVHANALQENIASGIDTAAEVIELWDSYYSQRSNIMSREFTTVGVGYVEDREHDVTYWVVIFGS